MRRTILLLAGSALLGACGGQRTTTEPTVDRQLRATAARGSPSAAVNEETAALRRVTAMFHDFKTADSAGWSARITDCMTDPAAGGMGFHYGNTALFDGSVSVEQPELLLYEPERNRRLRLVAVEYIIPYSAHSRSAAPPVLFSQQFKQNDVFQLWGLHAWVWKHNPSGLFADWNPRVTCAHAASVSAMAHH